jgi:hypothetical protein
MSKPLFTFSGSKMLFWRLGGINSVKQTHWGKTHLSHDDKPVLFHQPPVKRGIWCFPEGQQDYFFAYGQWERRLPKKFQDPVQFDFDKETDESCVAFWAERDACMKKIQQDFPPSTFWYGGEFYSHIGPHKNQVSYDNWFLWDNPKTWAATAVKHIFVNQRMDGKLWTSTYAKDHLECFIPNY